MKPMKKRVKKLYNGKAELRSFDVQKCIKEGRSFHIIFENDIMVLTSEELTTKRISSSRTFESKIDGQDYKLYGYYWEPETKEEL